MSASAAEYTNANIWDEWVPESALAAVLSGQEVIADIGQVKGAWKRPLEHEVRNRRLVKWRGHWFPNAGAPWGIGPLKTCYGTPEVAAYWANVKRGIRVGGDGP